MPVPDSLIKTPNFLLCPCQRTYTPAAGACKRPTAVLGDGLHGLDSVGAGALATLEVNFRHAFEVQGSTSIFSFTHLNVTFAVVLRILEFELRIVFCVNPLIFSKSLGCLSYMSPWNCLECSLMCVSINFVTTTLFVECLFITDRRQMFQFVFLNLGLLVTRGYRLNFHSLL